MKASEAQKKANRAYYERTKGKYKTISITQTAEQTERDKETLKRHNTTVLQVWRKAIEALENGDE